MSESAMRPRAARVAAVARSARFVLVSAAVVVSRALDVVTTRAATPDLAREANPLHRLLGFGWGPLLLVNGAVVLLLVVAAARAAFAPPRLPAEPGLDYETFIGRFWFGGPVRSSATRAAFWLPADPRVRWAFIGGPVAWLVVAASVVIAVWNTWARSPAARHMDPRLVPLAIIVFWCTVAVALWWSVRRFLASAYARYEQRGGVNR